MDISVVLNARILTSKEIENFLWCTSVLLGSRKISFEGLVTVDAAKLEIDDLGWDTEALAQMSKSFVRWLSVMPPKKRRKIVKKLANKAGQLIKVDGVSYPYLRALLLNLLLPGCCLFCAGGIPRAICSVPARGGDAKKLLTYCNENHRKNAGFHG